MFSNFKLSCKHTFMNMYISNQNGVNFNFDFFNEFSNKVKILL